MKFVLLALRESRHIADAEYDDFLALSGLTPEELDMRVLDRPDSGLGDFSDVDGVFNGGSAFTITKPADAVWQPAVSERLVEFEDLRMQDLFDIEHPVPKITTFHDYDTHISRDKVQQRAMRAISLICKNKQSRTQSLT